VSLVLRVYVLLPTPPHDSLRSHEAEKTKWEMDGKTRKDTRRTVQDKDNAPSNNQPKITKDGRPEEANFVKKQVSLRSSPTRKHISVSDTETHFRVHP
jgi:hypothetical protein